jgi:hypothetical protein
MIFVIYYLLVSLTMPVYQLTVTGAPLVVRVPEFEKPLFRV